MQKRRKTQSKSKCHQKKRKIQKKHLKKVQGGIIEQGWAFSKKKGFAGN